MRWECSSLTAPESGRPRPRGGHTMKIVPHTHYVLIVCVVFVAGCAAGWSRPNTTEAEFHQDRFQCEQQAASMYPVVMRSSGPGVQAPATTNCTTMPGMPARTNC